MNNTYTLISLRFMVSLGGLTAFIIALLLVTETSNAQVYSDNSVKIHKQNNKNTVIYNSRNGLQNFELEYHGKIQVTEDDKDIRAISPGGYLEISKTTFGSKRSIYIEAESGGKLKKEYYEGRKEMPFIPEGKKWLAEILPEIVRTTRIAAESRVDRFYTKGGVAEVLDEIGLITSDYVKIYYGELLLNKSGLSTNDLIKIVSYVSQSIQSDYYLASLLKDKSNLFLNNDRSAEAYFAALSTMDSDYYMSVVLKNALENSKPSSAAMKKIMEAVNKMNSDYYQTVVISSILDYESLDGEVLYNLINTSRSISSDYYQSTILKRALEHENITPDAFNTLLTEISNISSEHYMASLFGELLDKPGIGMDTKIKIINTLSEKMNSDHYLASLLSKMLVEGDMTSALAESVFNAVSNMNSDYYASSVITSASRRSNMDKKSLVQLINATSSIESDFYQSAALSSMAPMVNRLNDSEIKNAYMAAAKHIQSDTYYGQSIKALD